MKWIIKIGLIVSVTINVYFIYDDLRLSQEQKLENDVKKAYGGDITKTSWEQGIKTFSNKLNENKRLSNKKYYYVNVWTNWCLPCLREMPWLDSIAGVLRKDIGYVFVTDISDNIANNCIKRKSFKVSNFIFMNDMGDFISGICNKKGISAKVYPMELVLNNKGELLYFSTGAYENRNNISEFKEMISKLP